jgi:hypothetical protein
MALVTIHTVKEAAERWVAMCRQTPQPSLSIWIDAAEQLHKASGDFLNFAKGNESKETSVKQHTRTIGKKKVVFTETVVRDEDVPGFSKRKKT